MNTNSNFMFERYCKADSGWLWPACWGGVLLALGALLVWLTSSSVSAQEAEGEAWSTFSPEVVISVPQTDANNDGVNDFSGTTIEVSYRYIGRVYRKGNSNLRCV